jgi:HPt (histidine-containing phosphotransfer) domain-containing protein
VGEEPPSLDPVAIESLRALEGPDDPDFFANLVAEFLKHADGALVALRVGIERGNAKEVETVAHGLKGSAGNMGALRMHRLCADLQKADETRALRQATPLLESLAADYLIVRARLQQEARRRPAPPID